MNMFPPHTVRNQVADRYPSSLEGVHHSAELGVLGVDLFYADAQLAKRHLDELGQRLQELLGAEYDMVPCVVENYIVHQYEFYSFSSEWY